MDSTDKSVKELYLTEQRKKESGQERKSERKKNKKEKVKGRNKQTKNDGEIIDETDGRKNYLTEQRKKERKKETNKQTNKQTKMKVDKK